MENFQIYIEAISKMDGTAQQLGFILPFLLFGLLPVAYRTFPSTSTHPAEEPKKDIKAFYIKGFMNGVNAIGVLGSFGIALAINEDSTRISHLVPIHFGVLCGTLLNMASFALARYIEFSRNFPRRNKPH